MALPTNRNDFRDYCLRKLGAPVIEINVDPDQVEDRIDEALHYWMDYHFDGADKIYYKYAVTTTDITNRYITMPQNIIGVVNIFPIGQILGSDNMFNIRYQIALNDLYTLTSVSMTPYYMAMEQIQFLEQMLVGQQPLRYNRHQNILYIDMDWNLLNVGDYLVVEAYQIVDPDLYTRAWGDRWLARYATCLIKLQWGSNLSKYQGMELPGGMKFNGDKIYNDALREREEMEREMIMNYSMPAMDMIGPA